MSITIILATPWHVDDIIGRIEKRLDKTNEAYDKDFPKFKVVSLGLKLALPFPAMNGTVTITDKNDKQKKIKYEYLFPERFSKDWYTQQFASLGAYSAQALLQCDPQIRGGNLIDTTKIKYHNDTSDFPKTKYYRVWDLAHSAKQTQKDDPDYTSGTLLCYTKIQGLWHLWIKDVERIRGKASERDIFIQAVTQKDGAGVGIAVENSIDAKDAIDAMQTILKGTRIVQAVTIRIDKVARVSYIEPIFEAGNVHILKADWNLDWLKEVQDFPSARHDDQVDNLTAGYELCCNTRGQLIKSKVLGV